MSAKSICISPENTGLWEVQQTSEAAAKASELLNHDLENHHVFLNNKGFHDHMPHHILALYGTGASVAQLERAYSLRDSLQRAVEPRHGDIASALAASWDNAAPHLGRDDYYPDFLAHFQQVIDDKGYEAVVNEYLFKGDAHANDLLIRLHAGVLHSLLQLMFALEWKQPAIVAEALAQTCVHQRDGLDGLLLKSERRARHVSQPAKMPTLLSLFQGLRADPQLRRAARFTDSNKIRDGILQRAEEAMLVALAQVHVGEDEVEERMAEMLHTIIYVASSAAIHPPHYVKYDFFLMHHVNSAIFYLTINKQAWISPADKARLLEWKIRMDFLEPIEGSVREIGLLLQDFGDDGHAIKQARVNALCHELMSKYDDKPWAVLKGDDIWRKIQAMTVDAVEGPGVLYVRSGGFEEVWKDVPLQSATRRNSDALRALQAGSGASPEALATS
ncbi:Oxidoreductase AgnL3 like protein [Verticillium longisporum]|nr:Oxidoreductase AgnL3 like protein [Verticillium longisporum]